MLRKERQIAYECNENITEECIKLIEGAQRIGLRLRAFGGAAIWLSCHNTRDWLVNHHRLIKDIDLVCESTQLRPVLKFFADHQYSEEPYTARYTAQWQRTFTSESWKKVDLSVDRLEYCHTINLWGRLEIDRLTISQADLFLSKVQNVNMTTSDRLDLIALCEEHEVVDELSDTDSIEEGHITDVLRKDWGFCHTTLGNIDLLISDVLIRDGLTNARKRLKAIRKAVFNAPKTLRWHLRDIIGSRTRWYKEVD